MAQESAGRNPTGREKNGSKRNALWTGMASRLSLIVTGGRTDMTKPRLALLLDDAISTRRAGIWHISKTASATMESPRK